MIDLWMCYADVLVDLDLSMYSVDASVVLDLCRCAQSMHLLYLTSLDVLLRFKISFVDFSCWN